MPPKKNAVPMTPNRGDLAGGSRERTPIRGDVLQIAKSDSDYRTDPDKQSILEERISRILGNDRFSKRQVQIIALLSRGYSHKEAAAKLDIDRHTVTEHLSRLAIRCGFSSVSDLRRTILDELFRCPVCREHKHH